MPAHAVPIDIKEQGVTWLVSVQPEPSGQNLTN